MQFILFFCVRSHQLPVFIPLRIMVLISAEKAHQQQRRWRHHENNFRRFAMRGQYIFSITSSFLQPHFEKIKFPKRTFSLPSIYGIIVSPKRLTHTTFNLMKLPPAQTHEIYVNFGVRLVWPLLHVHICRIINSFLCSSGLARRFEYFCADYGHVNHGPFRN